MATLLTFETPTGPVKVEVDSGPRLSSEVISKVGAEGVLPPMAERAVKGMEGAFDVVRNTASAFVKQISEMAARPSSLEVEFGMKADGETGLFTIAKAGGAVHFTVKMKWKTVESPQAPAGGGSAPADE